MVKKKVLITGVAGFIGSNLAEAFLEKNYTVVGIDNFSTGYKRNIKPFLNHTNFRFIEGDIRDLSFCQSICKDIDYILHQAALGSVPRSIENPIRTNDNNVNGFLNMLVAAKDNNVKRFVYAASSSTYGDSIKLPKVEHNIGKPLSPYAVSKLVNELYADVFHKVYDLDTIGLRYFNVFGKRQDPSGAYAAVIPKFVVQFMNHQSPVINGDGTFSRDFTYIENVIQMNLRAVETNNPDALNQIYNTAVGDRITIKEMAELIKQYLKEYDPEIEKIEILHGPNRNGDIPHSRASIEKAKKLLNYQPSYTFEEGLKKATKWYWENLKS